MVLRGSSAPDWGEGEKRLPNKWSVRFCKSVAGKTSLFGNHYSCRPDFAGVKMFYSLISRSAVVLLTLPLISSAQMISE